MKSGIAGKIIVSSNMTISPKQLKMIRMLHPELWVSFTNLAILLFSPRSDRIAYLNKILKRIINALK
jgi:hypothetical protein